MAPGACVSVLPVPVATADELGPLPVLPVATKVAIMGGVVAFPATPVAAPGLLVVMPGTPLGLGVTAPAVSLPITPSVRLAVTSLGCVGIAVAGSALVGVWLAATVGATTVGGGAVGIVWCCVLARPIGIRYDSQRLSASSKAEDNLNVSPLVNVCILSPYAQVATSHLCPVGLLPHCRLFR